MNKEREPRVPPQDKEFLSNLRLLPFTKKERYLIEHAYGLSKVAHEGQYRKGGAPYFEHPRAVANILIQECGVTDFDTIVSALLHDTLEDTRLFANPTEAPFNEYKEKAGTILAQTFGRTVAKMVLSLSKPYAGPTPTDQEKIIYYTGLRDSLRERPKTILVKMADRLHNLRTIGDMPPAKQRRKIRETNNVYIPLFTKLIQEADARAEELSLAGKSLVARADSIQDGVGSPEKIQSIRTHVKEINRVVDEIIEVQRAGGYLLSEILAITKKEKAQ